MSPFDARRERPRTRYWVAAATAERFRPSLRYLLSAWHLNQRVDNSPFSFLQEQELCKMAQARSQSGTPLSQSTFCALVYRFAVRFNRASTGHLQAWRNSGGRAGKKWLRSFLTRYPEIRNALGAQPAAAQSGPRRRLPTSKAMSDEHSAESTSTNDQKENKRDLHPAQKKLVTISYKPTKIESSSISRSQQRDRIGKQRNTRQVIIETVVR